MMSLCHEGSISDIRHLRRNDSALKPMITKGASVRLEYEQIFSGAHLRGNTFSLSSLSTLFCDVTEDEINHVGRGY